MLARPHPVKEGLGAEAPCYKGTTHVEYNAKGFSPRQWKAPASLGSFRVPHVVLSGTAISAYSSSSDTLGQSKQHQHQDHAVGGLDYLRSGFFNGRRISTSALEGADSAWISHRFCGISPGWARRL